MANLTWIGGADEVAQVWKGTITTTTNGHTYTVTLTDDNGDTSAISYEVANPPDTTATLVAEGFIAAWNASTDARIARITATNSAGQVILTADDAGVPFTASTSGTGTWSGTGNTTPNSGPTDGKCAANYAESELWTGSDNVTITGTYPILYNTNWSGTSLGIITYAEDASCQVGSPGHRLRLDCTQLRWLGYGKGYVDIGASNISPTMGINAQWLDLIGSDMATVNVSSGTLFTGTKSGETATASAIRCWNTGNVVVGAGTTLTTLDKNSSGTSWLYVAATTVSVGSGTLYTEGTGAVTTMNCKGGIIVSNSTGTITTINASATGIVDLRQSSAARTVTNGNVQDGAAIRTDSHITHTNQIKKTTTKTSLTVGGGYGQEGSEGGDPPD